MKRFFLILFLAPVSVTLLSTLIPYQFCMDGPGYGLPMAFSHPAHGRMPHQFVYKGYWTSGRVIDTGSLLVDFAFWGLVLGLPAALIDLRRARRNATNPGP